MNERHNPSSPKVVDMKLRERNAHSPLGQFHPDEEMLQATARIKKQRDVIMDRLDKMNESKDKVSSTVFEKVRRDYALQLETVNELLNEKKRTLKDQIKKLYVNREKLSFEINRHREILEEAEFRHLLGEFTQSQYQEVENFEAHEIEKLEADLAHIAQWIRTHEELFDPEDFGAPKQKPRETPAPEVRTRVAFSPARPVGETAPAPATQQLATPAPQPGAQIQVLQQPSQPVSPARQAATPRRQIEQPVKAPLAQPQVEATRIAQTATFARQTPAPVQRPPAPQQPQERIPETPAESGDDFASLFEAGESGQSGDTETNINALLGMIEFAPASPASAPVAPASPSLLQRREAATASATSAPLPPPPPAPSKTAVAALEKTEVALKSPPSPALTTTAQEDDDDLEALLSAEDGEPEAQAVSPLQLPQPPATTPTVPPRTAPSLDELDIPEPAEDDYFTQEKVGETSFTSPSPQPSEEESVTTSKPVDGTTPPPTDDASRKTMTPDATKPVSRDDSISNILNSIKLDEDDAKPTSPAVAPGQVPPVASAPGSFRLVLKQGDLEQSVYPLGENLSIGRSPSNDIMLKEPKVSRQHAAINKYNEHYIIIDLKSSNGVYVNGAKVDECVLHAGDEISVGGYKFLFEQV